jgi:hypothetical protein
MLVGLEAQCWLAWYPMLCTLRLLQSRACAYACAYAGLPVSVTQMQSVLLEVQSAVLLDDTLRDEQRAKACSAVALADKVRHCKQHGFGCGHCTPITRLL